jgi:hypothetical protein
VDERSVVRRPGELLCAAVIVAEPAASVVQVPLVWLAEKL